MLFVYSLIMYVLFCKFAYFSDSLFIIAYWLIYLLDHLDHPIFFWGLGAKREEGASGHVIVPQAPETCHRARAGEAGDAG